jgi:hypothetical protein
MAENVKLPVIGATKRGWVIAGGALIVGIVGYAWWNRARTPAEPELLPEDIPQDREPPATVVGSENFDTEEVRSIIDTNTEWYTAAVEYLSTTGGFDFGFTTITLGKFLTRRTLTEQEANLVQAAKGVAGEPPQGGPWPIIRTTASGPSTGIPLRENLIEDISTFFGRRVRYIDELKDQKAARTAALRKGDVPTVKRIEGRMRQLQNAIGILNKQIAARQTAIKENYGA